MESSQEKEDEMLPKCECGADQVPGRTISESDYSDIAEWARNYSNRGWEGRTVLAGAGITIVPDPEPTNAEQIIDLMGLAPANLNRRELAKWLDARGVKAGGDDE